MLDSNLTKEGAMSKKIVFCLLFCLITATGLPAAEGHVLAPIPATCSLPLIRAPRMVRVAAINRSKIPLIAPWLDEEIKSALSQNAVEISA